MEIWIGTSGYSYAEWVGDFYPPGLRPERMLAHYCRHFPMVELNFTFYRPPTPEMLDRLAGQTPAEFQFLVKLPQTLSHEQSPRDLAGFRQAVLALHQRKQLLGLLCQLPQSIHDSARNRAWLETLADALGDLRLAVEFRHRSWATPQLASWLSKRDLDLVAVDAPSIPALFPSGLVQSTPRVYVRLHSRRAGTWYEGGVDRYDYNYSDDELGEWIGALAGADGTDQALFLFNNCHRGQAAINARRMQTLFSETAPDLHLTPPFAAPAPVQGVLFE
jgi:uncharacterized protein YecE (DUF72 family)